LLYRRNNFPQDGEKSNLAEGFIAGRTVNRALHKSTKKKIARNCIGRKS